MDKEYFNKDKIKKEYKFKEDKFKEKKETKKSEPKPCVICGADGKLLKDYDFVLCDVCKKQNDGKLIELTIRLKKLGLIK